ncbi:MAG: tyrosine--tRNA ligase [Nitrososphaerota archaeon]|nr:tyrosine--tRNA ligase [Candidatus Bathyarchaeota archaeon]MDW8048247.1 tyrosine--tRNA ligase [Nitrososphaerota archaeon]
MDINGKLNLIVRNTEEIVTREELHSLLETKSRPKAYWGFECSGFMHVGMGLICGSKIKDMVKAGFDFIIFLADWHSWINNKLGGKMENIRLAGEYFKECFEALGVITSGVKVVWASDIVGDVEYWEKVVRIAKSSSLLRVRRSLTIMGREMDSSDIETAWLLYPCMQVADIFHMDLDVAVGGIDQRKAHMLARDVAEKVGWRKPVCIHTPLLLGLQKPEGINVHEGLFDEDSALNRRLMSKMSKSKPESCIFVHDPPEEIRKKMMNAYCPPRQEEGNPVLEHAQYIIFPICGNMEIQRPSKYGGSIVFENYEELRAAYLRGEVHPLDLKSSVAEALIEILEPVREHFRRKSETLEELEKIEMTR